MKSLGVKISNIQMYLPETIVSNQNIIEEHNLRLKDQWVKDNIGITERRWTDLKASELGSEVLKKLNIVPEALIFATVSQDYNTPATATVVQGKTHPGKLYPAFDVTAACSGFLYALDIGQRFIRTGMKQVACIASEVRSRDLNKQDRRTVMLFGDGAAGVILTPCEEGEVGIIDIKTMADGRYHDAIVVPNGGKIEMRDAAQIFQSAIEQMQNLVTDTLKENNLNLDDIDYFIIHQASKVIVEKVSEALELPSNKVFMHFPTRGNMTSASTAVSLCEAHEDKKIKKGDLVLVLATGGGFSAGISIMRWEI